MYFNTALSKKKISVSEISIYSARNGGIDSYHLSEELYSFTALENLYISEDFLAFSPKIAALKNLKYLYINSKLLKELPEEIGQLEQLSSLSISGDIFEKLPDSLAQLKNLKRLSITNCPKMTVIPKSLRQLPNLETLSLYKGQWIDLTAFEEGFEQLQALVIHNSPLTNAQIAPVFQLKALNSLTLSESNLTSIPKDILTLSNLKSLSFSKNNIKEIPSFLTQLSGLERFSFDGNEVQQFPVFLHQLPSLNKLGWQDNQFGKYDKALLAFPIEVTNPYSKAGESTKYQTFLEKIMACNFSEKTLELFFNIQNGKALLPQQFERAHFLELLSFDNKNFKSTVIDQLLEYEKARFEANPLTKDSTLVVIGKTTVAKSKIRSLLKEKNIHYQTKITPATSHLLLGNTGIKEYSMLENSTYILISQQAFQEYINEATKPYLLEEEAQDNLEHIAHLLSSPATENQQLGIELLKGGGTPKELLTELFIVYKFSEDKKLAAKAKKLLSANASTALLEKLKLRVNLRAVKEEYHTKTKIEDLTAGTELATWKIAQYACLLYPKIWGCKTHLGLKDAPEAAIVEFLPKAVRLQSINGSYTIQPAMLPYIQLIYQHCNFLQEIRFNKTAQNIDGIASMSQVKSVTFYFVEQASLPKDLHLMPNLEQVDFTSTTLPDWGAVLEQLSNSSSLKRLSFWSTMRTGLPSNFIQLQQLEQLSFTRVVLEDKDLALLAQLPHLKKVSFDNSSADLEVSYLQLQQVEEFYFRQSEPYQITPRLSELTQLKKLVLTGPFSFEGSLQLPQLESLFLESNYRKRQPILWEHIHLLHSLKTLDIRGEVIDLPKILPNFKQLEQLTLMHNAITVQELIVALKQLPHLQHLQKYFSNPDLQLLQKALPHLVVNG